MVEKHSMLIQNAIDFLPILLRGAVVTVEVTIYSLLLSTILGLILGLLKVSHLR